LPQGRRVRLTSQEDRCQDDDDSLLHGSLPNQGSMTTLSEPRVRSAATR
jgi:hypothetical protein